MRLLRIELDNFKVLRGYREYDIPDGIIGIVGHNGRGKSTLMNAVGWALYGPEIIPGGKSNVITWGEKHARVSVFLEIDGDTYIVTRTQTPRTGDASVYKEADQIATGLEPTTRTVEEILGVDRAGFLASVYSRQEDLAGLSSLTPANRMKTVMRLRGISRMNDAIEKIRADAREEKKLLGVLRSGTITEDEALAAIKDANQLIETVTTKIQGLEETAQKEDAILSGLLAEQARLSKQESAYRTYLAEQQEVTLAVEWAERSLADAERDATLPEPARPGPEPPRPDTERLGALRAEAEAVSRDLVRLRAEAEGQTTVCPCCKRPYDNIQDIEAHKNEVNQQILDQQNRLGSISLEIDAIVNSQSIYSEWSAINEQWQGWNNSVRAARDNEQKLRVQLEMARSAEENFRVRTRPQDPAPQEAVLSENIADAQAAIRATHYALATSRERLRSLREALGRAESDLARAEAASARVAERERLSVTLDVAASEMVRLKEGLLAELVPSLSASASRLMSEMTDGKYTDVRLTPDYDIEYRADIGEWQRFENLSGGEKDVCALAFRLALSDLTAQRIGVLFLDEIMESLDIDRQESVWGALERLTKRYSQIFVVTHVADLKDRAPYAIAL